MLYGVRLAPAVFVLSLYAAKPNPEGAGVKAGTHGVSWGEARAPRALTQERPEDYLASSPERKNSRDEPESRTPPLETSPRGCNERGWPGDSKRSTEPFEKKDHTSYRGAQRQWGVWGALPTSSVAYDRADCQPRTSRGQSRRCLGLSTACTDRSGDCGVGRTFRHEPASFPCGRSACHAPGSHPPASVWLFRPSTRALRCGGDSPASGGSPGRRRRHPEAPAGGKGGAKWRRSRHPCGP